MGMFTEAELADMSDEERAFAADIKDDDPDLTGEADAAGESGSADDAAAETKQEAEAAADGGGDAEAQQPVDGKENAGDADGPEPDAEKAEKSIEPEPMRRVAPGDASDQRASLRAERSQALAKLLDGELTQEEFAEVDSRVDDKLNELIRAEATDQAREHFANDAMLAEYKSLLAKAHQAGAAMGLDGLDDADSELGQEFDRAIRMFAMEAGERGMSDRPGALSASSRALNEALQLMAYRHSKAMPTSQAAAKPAQEPDKKAAPAREVKPVDRSALPPTLAQAPTAADATVSSEFAHLDGLDPEALEKAVARMSPDEQDRYLAA